MKALKKLSVLLMMCFMLAGIMVPMQAEAASLNKTKATVYVGDSVKLKLTGTSKKKTWTSSNKSVATVSSAGLVKAKKAGTATITVKYGTAKKTCKVTVQKAPTLTATKVTLNVDGTKTLKVNRPIGTVKWTTSNSSVATVLKGKITAKKAGTATIKATVNGRTLSCKVTVKNADATATALSFGVSDGGDFITGMSKATIKFKLSATSTAVKAQVLDYTGDVIYTKKFDKCKKNYNYSFVWDGTDSDGDYIPEGTYQVRITAGSVKTTSDFVKVYNESPFAGGTGAKTNPYQVEDIEDLKMISLYPTKHFKQIADIDGGLVTMTSLCTTDVPFSGSYNGNGCVIRNIRFNANGHNGLFVSVSGEIYNVKMNSIYATCTSTGKKYVACLAAINSGTVRGCTISDCVVSGATGNSCGALVGKNTGTISACKTTDSSITGATYSNDDAAMGGISGRNEGTIIDCTADSVAVSGWNAGGIAGDNSSSGQCVNCITIGSSTFDKGTYKGAIVGDNQGIINGCSTTTSYVIAGYNYSGTIIN